MNINILISLRNLLRQKRRNILLGIGIGFGMMILVMANSFTHGISDILFNKIIVYMAGHIQVTSTEKGAMRSPVIRDREAFILNVTNSLFGVKNVHESVTTFTRAVGNGKSENVVIVGMDISRADFFDFYKTKVKEGNIFNVTNKAVENPIIMYIDKAKDLNVKVNDVVRVRFNTIYGQTQSARCTVIALLETESSFQSMVTYVELGSLKALMGYQPWETGSLQVILNHPQSAIMQADMLHYNMTPLPAVINGKFGRAGASSDGSLMALKTNAAATALFTSNCVVLSGNIAGLTNLYTVAVSAELARRLGLQIGAVMPFTYQKRFGGTFTSNFTVALIVDPKGLFPADTVFTGELTYYDFYYRNKPLNTKLPEIFTPLNYMGIPENGKPRPPMGMSAPVTLAAPLNIRTNIVFRTAESFTNTSVLFPALTREYKLLARTSTTEEQQKKSQTERKMRYKGSTLDITTMYETASQIISLQQALDLITIIAVLILFFIILIGVINTLRMTVRERTREIGTLRAIGMQKTQVRNTFILETFFLGLFASIAGIIMSFVMMGLLSLITIQNSGPLSIMLVDNHLYFKPSFGSILGNLILILVITVFTAYFPSKRAARLSAADALRHYE